MQSMNRFRFSRDAANEPDVGNASQIAEVTLRLKDHRGSPKVTHEIKNAADERLIAMARDLAFTNKTSEAAALAHVVKVHPTLLALSRGIVVDEDEAEVA